MIKKSGHIIDRMRRKVYDVSADRRGCPVAGVARRRSEV